MIGELLVALFLGLGSGIITGLIPGLHINMVGALLATSAVTLSQFFSPISLALFLFATALTHTFIDAIPSTLLGAPNPDTVEMILPAHKMVLEGKGYEAVRLATMGAIIGMIVGLFIFFILTKVIPIIYEPISNYVGWLLLSVSFYFIVTESDYNKKFWALMIFLLSGVLGATVLTYPNLNQPLLPLLSGLFGISTLLVSIIQQPMIVEQQITNESSYALLPWVQTAITCVSAAWIASLLPGLGTSQATMAAKSALPKNEPKLFMIAAGGINTLNYLFSIATWLVLDKARNGAVVVMKELLEELSQQSLIIFLISSIIITGCATIITLNLGRVCAKVLNNVPYEKVCYAIIFFLTVLVTIISGPKGVFILILSTALGVLTQLVGIRKSSAMGCLVIPVIIFFIF